MKKKKIFLLSLLLIVIIIIISSFIFFRTKDKEIINKNLFLELKDNDSHDVYTVSNLDKISFIEESYQKDIDNLIYNKKNDKLYTADSPLLILNPYGTNTTGLYIYFYTFFKYKIEYTISVSDPSIPDFTNTLPDEMVRKHEGQIIGLIQGMENTITLKLVNRNNKVKAEYEYKINIPDYDTTTIKIINSNILVENEKISDGLYMVTNINNSEIFNYTPLSFYDRNGILRAEFTKKSGHHTQRALFIDGNFLYSITSNDYVLVNRYGKIEKKYPISLKNNHDYIYSEFNNSLLYIAGTNYIKKLNLKTGEDTVLLDLNVLMKSYRDKAISYYKQSHNDLLDEEIDWAHPNSIEIVNNKDLILSLRENSSIVYVSDVYKNPTIKYIIAPKRIYEGTEFEKYLLKQVGDFPIHAGQHTVLLENNDNLKKGQYYLYMFNNNYAKSETVFNDDWIDTVEGTGRKNRSADNSMYYKYLIDENKKTFTLVDSFNVAYSNAKSNIQIYYDGNYISTSGKKATIQEFDKDKKLLLELRLDVYNDIYRAYKCDMKDFWFGSSYRYTKSETTKNKVNTSQEQNNSDFHYSKKTNTILGINTGNSNSKESNIIYYDNIYFTIYDYHTDTLTIPSSINGTEIKRITGINYANVKKIIIEEGIEEIGDYAFLGCENLEEIVLPSTLNNIGKYAFVLCNNVKELNIPVSVKYIGQNAFKGWNENQTVNVIKNWQKFSGSWKSNSKAKFNKGVKNNEK